MRDSRITFNHQRHQADQRSPRAKRIAIQQRDAEYRAVPCKQMQQRVIEQQAAEQKQRREALSPLFMRIRTLAHKVCFN